MFPCLAGPDQSEQFDWLGFSRPDLNTKDGKDTAAAEKPVTTAAASRDGGTRTSQSSDASLTGQTTSKNVKADEDSSR